MTSQSDSASAPRSLQIPGTFRMMLAGEIDLSRKQELASLGDAYQASEDPDLQIDFTRVTFMDSTGLGWLLRMQATATARGGTVCLIGLSDLCRRVLEITAIDQLVEIRTVD